MDTLSTEELVLVHLLDATAASDRTTAGICDALGVGSSVSERVAVLSALSSLQERGLLVKHDRGQQQTSYELTDNGQRAASKQYEAVADRSITVVDTAAETSMSVAEAAAEIDVSSIAPVAEQVSEGTLRLDDIPEDTFVGRTTELDQIEHAADRVRSGTGGVVTIVGGRGVGKTELLRRAIDRVDEADTAILPVTCRPVPDEPYGPLKAALADHGKDDIFDRDHSTLDQSGALVQRRTELFREVRAAIESLAETGLALVFLDDFHTASPETVELFDALTDRLPDGALVVATSRPADPTDSAAAPIDRLSANEGFYEELTLGPLDRDNTRELIVRLLADRDVPESFTDRLYEQTGGTPLFVTGTVDELRERGAIDSAAGVYPAADTPLPTPEDISEAIRRRLAALPDDARETIEIAAVLGHAVNTAVLTSVVDAPAATVREHIALFAQTGLFESGGQPRFLSEVIREVVLAGIDDDRQRSVHRTIADTYLETSSDPPYAAVARHYKRASDEEAALEQYLAAGDEALDVYANETALEHYEQALSMARELDATNELVEAVESIGRVYFFTGEYDDADRYFEYLRESTDDPHTVQRSYRYQSEIAFGRGDISAADEYANRGIGAVKIPTETTCRLVGHRGWFQMKRGNFDAAEEWFERQHTLAKQLDNQDRLGGAYHNLGTLAHDRGDIETAINYLERAVEHNEAAGADRDALASYNNLARSYTGTGRIEEAIETYKTIRERATKMGDRSTELLAKRNLSTVYHNKGNLDQALETAVETKQEAQNIGLERFIAGSLCSEGNVAIDQCSFERAGDCLTEALHRHETTENARMIAYTRTLLARLELYNGHLEAAHEQLTAAADYEDQVEPDLRAAIAFRRSDVARAEGRHEAAIEACNQALDYLQPSGHKQTRIEIRARLGEAQAAAPNNDTGLEHAQWAVDAVAEFELPLLASRAHVALASCHRSVGNYGPAVNALDAAEGSLAETDAPLYESLIAVERALLAAARGDDDASDRLDVALELSSDRGILLFADRCRETLSGLCPPD